MRLFSVTTALCFLFCVSATVFAESSPVRRFGMFIGANNGGRSRVTLRWATSDARKMAGVMQELGGIAAADTYYLADPDVEGVSELFSQLETRVADATVDSRRVEFIFYYSGHSNESGLLLHEEQLGYTRLRRLIQDIDADVSVAILDGCESGAFTRSKGGERVQPFIVDESADMQGFAYLTSSSDSEASQESDRIKTSFFTHFVLSGLRGAADSSQDNKVTLNELYNYAFRETLAMTSETASGPQHPSYDIQLNGTGDVTLSNLNLPESSLRFANDVSGRILVRSENGSILSEFSKNYGISRTIAVPTGVYEVTVSQPDNAWKTSVHIDADAQSTIAQGQLQPLSREITTVRGDTQRSVFSINLGIIPPFQIQKSFGSGSAAGIKLSLNLLAGKSEDVHGVAGAGASQKTVGNLAGLQFSGIASRVHGNTYGIHTAGIFQETEGNAAGISHSGIYSTIRGTSKGVQTSGIYSQADSTVGVQAALATNSNSVAGTQIGLVNYADVVYGTQIGLVNISEDMYGVPIGLINYVRNGINDISLWVHDSSLLKLGVRNGTRYVYSLFFLGFDHKEDWENLNDLIVGAGLGGRFYLPGPFFVDMDMSIARTIDKTADTDPIAALITPGTSGSLPVVRVVGGISAGRFGIYAGTSLYGELENSRIDTRYYGSDDVHWLYTPFGNLGVHPTIVTGITF